MPEGIIHKMAKLQRNQYRKGNKENQGGFQASFAREGKRARAERDTHARVRAWMDDGENDEEPIFARRAKANEDKVIEDAIDAQALNRMNEDEEAADYEAYRRNTCESQVG